MATHITKQTLSSFALKKFQRSLLATTAMTMAVFLSTTAVYADPGATELPTGFHSVDGGATQSSAGANMDVTQSTIRTVINWNTFNIGKDASVNFNQTQGANSVAVNRVQNSTIGSQIFGALTSNGKIMILDKNGVFFDQNSTINVGGIIASTAGMGSENKDKFLAGESFALTGADTGSVINNSTSFTVKDSGLLAFVAPWVENNGVITAKLGEVTLGAGRRLTVDFSGDEMIQLAVSNNVQNAFVKNAGTIDAQGGTVKMTAHAASGVVDEVINMSGVIKANSFSTHNGKIVLSANRGKINVSGTLDVSRAGDDAAEGTSAGTILIEGEDIFISAAAKILANIKATETTSTSTTTSQKWCYSGVCVTNKIEFYLYLDAGKATLAQFLASKKNVETTTTTTTTHSGSGNGGTVDILASNTVSFAGLIDVSAGGDAGNGGNVEISGANGLGYFGLVDASAENGTMGSLLLDPAVITVNNEVSGDVVNLTALKNTLNLANTSLLADEQVSFTVAADLSGVAGHLTLNAPRLSFLGDFTTKTGGVTFTGGQTVDLGGKIYRKGLDTFFFPVMLTEADLADTATTVNILGAGASIQQGVSFAASGATINVATGTYNENLSLHKSLTVLGTDATLFGVNFLAPSVVNISADNVTFDGFSLSGLNLNGITATDVTGLTLSNNSFTGFILGSGIKLDGVDNSTVSGNSFTGVLTAINAFDGLGNLDITGNIVTGTLGDAIVVDNSDDLTLAGNIIAVAGQNGIKVSNSKGATITLNAVLGAGEHGINLNTVEDVNLFLNAAGGSKDALHVEGAKGINVFLNAFGLTSENGISISNAEDANVFLNLIAETGADGVKISESNDVIVAANAILNAGGNGISVLNTENAGILLNYVSGAGNDGIYIDPTTGYVALNYITGAGNNGITVADSDGFLVAANYVDGSGNDGIHISNSDKVITTLNTVKNSGRDGIHVQGSEKNIIALNKVDGSDRDGIQLTGADNSFITLNSVANSGNDGISLWFSDESVVLLNKVSGSEDDGIQLVGSDKSLVTLNKVENSGDNGISSIGGSLSLFALNHVDGTTGGDGISVIAGALNTVTLNKVENTGDDGISVTGGLLNTVALNEVSHTGGDGISMRYSLLSSVIGNDVFDAGEDGIEVSDSALVLVGFNAVKKSGANGILADDTAGVMIVGNDIRNSGADGIHVSDSLFANVLFNDIRKSGDDGIQVSDGFFANIISNDVRNSGDNGIAVSGIYNVDIYGNTVVRTGTDLPPYDYLSHGNGILVESSKNVDIHGNTVRRTQADGIVANYIDGDLSITSNRVRNVGGNGISVYEAEDVFISRNRLKNGQSNGIVVSYADDATIRNNRVDDFYNGIVASSISEGVRIHRNKVNNSFADGIYVSNSPWSDITKNTVTNYGQDGIQLTSGSDHSLIAGNTIDAGTYTGSIIGFFPFLLEEGSGSQTTGIRLGDNYFPWFTDYSGVHDVMVSGNTVLNNDIGLNATAFNNGYIAIEGNQFTDNNIGLWIGSGLIDLTGETNTFTGGDIAMRFERQQAFSWSFPTLYIEGPSQEEGPSEPETLYSELALVDDTLGTTVFEGQSTYYIELKNGAFFAPGSPTIIDGTEATYDGVHGGLMTPEQLVQIESMIHDFDDDGSLGQIFAGYATLDDNLIRKKIRDNTYKAGKAGVIVTGLPSTQGTGTGNRFFSIQDLANLEPAAGGDDQQGAQLTAEQLAGLEPAAGGEEETNVSNCWSNAATAMGGSGIVSLDLSGDDQSAILADQSACDGGI